MLREIYTELRRIPILLATFADLQPNQAGKYSNHNSVVFYADAGVFLFVFFTQDQQTCLNFLR